MSCQNWKFFSQKKKKPFMSPVCVLFSWTQQKLEKSFEYGTFGKRCLTRGISAIATILNEKI